MPAYRRRTWWCSAAAVAFVAAACREATSPRLSDPTGLANDVQTVGAVFTTPVFQSYSAVADTIGTMAPPLRFGGALLQATSPVAPTTVGQSYAATPQQVQTLKQLAIGLSAAGTAGVIPDTLKGSIFAWDTTTHRYYRQAPSGGPPTGVRFLLYSVNPFSHSVIEHPLTAIGYVDLLDVSSGSTVGLRVVVVDTGSGSPVTLADYTVTATNSAPGSFSATADGFVSDGTHTLTFHVSFSITGGNTATPNVSLTVHWSLDKPAVTVDLTETVTWSDANHATISVNLTVTRGAETVAVTGRILAQNTPLLVTVDLTITLNGATYARITGDSNLGIQIRHADGTALSPDETAAVEQLFLLPADVTDVIEHLFHPAENLLHV